MTPGGRARRALALSSLVVLGVGLRAVNLGWPPLWADEAESAINALTILGTGLPLDNYRGLPLFENAMLRPWPGSEEYAFRDLSYSDRGLAVYHGWLPLYAMAGAFALAGVSPEEARTAPPARDASTGELVRWTAVPRWPGLVFSGLLVLFAWPLGRSLGGEGAGWAAALGSATAGFFVWTGRQARYYAPALALSAACGLAVWTAVRGGRARQHAVAGLALALLFHTHALSALVLAGVYVAALPVARDRRAHVLGLAVAGAVAGALVLPWAWWSGFLEGGRSLPAARSALAGRELLRSALPAGLLAAAGLLPLAAAALARRGRLPERLRGPLSELAPGLYFATAWPVLAQAAFVALVPAASYFPARLKLSYAVPGLLVAALVLTLACRLLPRGARASAAAPPLAMALALVASGHVNRAFPRAGQQADEHEVARALRDMRLPPGTRVYASPNQHLMLTYYTGIPVQSVSAVRASWLEELPDLVIVESPWFEALPLDHVQELARRRGRTLTAEEARDEARAAVRQATIADLRALGVPAAPEPAAAEAAAARGPLAAGPLNEELVEATRRGTRASMRDLMAGSPFAAAAASARNWSEFWQAYFFFGSAQIHDAPARLPRVRSGRTRVLPSGWIVHDCRGAAYGVVRSPEASRRNTRNPQASSASPGSAAFRASRSGVPPPGCCGSEMAGVTS